MKNNTFLSVSPHPSSPSSPSFLSSSFTPFSLFPVPLSPGFFGTGINGNGNRPWEEGRLARTGKGGKGGWVGGWIEKKKTDGWIGGIGVRVR